MKPEYAILKFFRYEHLPENLQEISKPFHQLAHKIVKESGESEAYAEVAAGLRKLLEAKDCIVRSYIK